MAPKIARYPAHALEATKQALRNSWHMDLQATINTTFWTATALHYSEAFKEGVDAFLEKRPPNFGTETTRGSDEHDDQLPIATDGPLRGVVVVDLGHFYMAPYTTLLMALGGADVIKVEPLDGEHLRFRGENRGAMYPFVMLNSNKRSVTLNLKSSGGGELLTANGSEV